MYQKLNNFIQINYINHEIDDFNNSDYLLSRIKYQKTDTNDKRYKLNKHEKALNQRNYCANSVLFDIANINKEEEKEMLVKNKKIEDYLNKSSIQMKNIDLIKINRIQYDISNRDNNFWGEISQPKSLNIDRTSTKFNILKNQKDNSNKIIENEKLTSNKNIISIDKKRFSIFLNKKSKIFKEKYRDNLGKKQKKFHPILEMPYIEIPEEETNKKKETEEIKQLRKEAMELSVAREEERKRYNQNKKMKNSIQNNIKGKFCTDSEGRIVMIKEIQPESLLREFSPIESNQKEILPGKTFQAFLKEKNLMEQKAKKNIIYNTGYININKDSDKNKMNDLRLMKRKSKYKINDINSLREEIFNIQPPPLTHFSPRHEKIEPSGSNFKIINPSIGVKIKEKNKIKVGGDNYFEKFHKYSINEFNKTLKETLEWETKLKLKGNLLNNYNNNMNEIIKEEKDFENNKISHPDKTFRKTFSGGFKNRKNILKSNSDIFVINHKYPVLKEILLNDEEPFNIYRIKKMEKALSNENIFDRNIKSSIGRIINKNPKNCKYDLIDEFNKELIKGNFMYKNSKKLFLPKLPPRHKLFNLLNNLSFNKTTNNFYRTRKKPNNEILSSLSSPLSANNKKNKRILSNTKDNY